MELSPTTSEVCAHCRWKILDQEGCKNKACPASVAEAQAREEKVANEDEDSSDESPLLSSAGNSRQPSSNASMDGDPRRHRQREEDDEERGEEEHCHSQATFGRMVARELRNQTVKNRLLGAVMLTAAFAAAEFAAGWYITRQKGQRLLYYSAYSTTTLGT